MSTMKCILISQHIILLLSELELSFKVIVYDQGRFLIMPRCFESSFSYSNSSNATIIKKLCKSKKLVKSQSGHTEMITSDLQRVFPYDHSVIWQVFWFAKLFNDGGVTTIAIWEWLFTAKRKLERLQFSTSSSFVKIWSACSCEFKAYFWTDIYITETGTTELENLSHNIIDIFIIET